MVADFCYERAMLTVMRSEVLDRLFYWVKYRRGIVQGLILLITSQREPQTWNKSVTFQAKKKRFNAVTKLIILAFTLSSESSGRNKKGERTARKASNPWRKTDTFMQIRCGIFLTMQTLVDNKLFALGLWQFVWICKYYRANGEQEKEGEIRLLICNLVLRSEGACNSAVAWG